MKLITLLTLIILSPVHANEDEIEYLMNEIKNSKAIFIRNGEEHSGQKAFEHVEMKYKKKGQVYVIFF